MMAPDRERILACRACNDWGWGEPFPEECPSCASNQVWVGMVPDGMTADHADSGLFGYEDLTPVTYRLALVE